MDIDRCHLDPQAHGKFSFIIIIISIIIIIIIIITIY